MLKERKKGLVIIISAILVILTLIIINILNPKAESIDHTHIWATTYNDTHHWQYCKVCSSIQNKVAHTLKSNGGSKLKCDNGYYNDCYRDICDCGYQSLPQVVIHGRYENYATNKRLNYGNMSNYYLKDIKQITKAEFQSIYSTSTGPGGQAYTWTDDDGDGYGWVFCGGPVSSANGAKSTLQLILGTNNIKDFGRGDEFDEMYILCRYINANNSLTRQGFINQLKSKSELDTDHLLYGLKEKYQTKVTDAQWAQILTNFKGYHIHASSWGWSSMNILHTGHPNNGQSLYSSGACYDSSNNHNVSYSDGIKTDCDLCGAHYTGNENYTSNTWYQCAAGVKLAEGQTKTCGGHGVVGIGNVRLGTCYCTFKKVNGNVYRVKVEAVPSAGYTYISTCTENLLMSKSSLYSATSYGYYGTVRFQNADNSIGRTINCGAYLPLTDEEAPVVTNVKQNPQSYINEWATINELTITGTEVGSDTVYISLKNKASGKTILNKEAVMVSNNAFTYVATPELEGTAEGVAYTITVTDLRNNTSTYDFIVYKTDSSAPQLNSSNIYTNWSGPKTIKLDFLDYGSKGVQLSFNNQTSYVDLPTSDGITYTWSRTFNTPMNGNTVYKIYVKDGLGNATVYNLTVGNIDTLKPTINKVVSETSGSNLKVTITASDDLSRVVGYAVTNSTSVPTSWSTSNTVTVATSNAKYVWVKDAAGNTRYQSLLKLTALVDNTGNGLVNLDWSTYTTENRVFKGYQSKDNGATWQSISLMDYTSVAEIKVLQIYPVDSAANQLKTWMETNGYGKGIIKADAVSLSTYNSNPNAYLKNTDGSWKYDVIFFGTWDSNGSNGDLNATSKAATEQFILSGNGCIFGHDTLRTVAPNFFELGQKYLDIVTSTKTYSGEPGLPNSTPTAGQPSTIQIVKKGLFTTYPWDIGEIGDFLSVPGTHNSQATNASDIWLRFYLPTYSAADMTSNNNFYLVTKNNCSMIQTGHSSGQATADEQKIIANLIFYSYQLTSATSVTDYSAMDVSKPTKPTLTVSGTTYKFASSDTGTKYLHKIEAYNKQQLSAPVEVSNTTTTTVMTGLKEYRYLFSNDANTVLTATTGTAVATTTAQVSNSANAADYKYLHVVAVDNTGNVSDTMTIDLKRTVTVKHYQLTVTGTKPSTPFATETYQVIANTSFKAPVNSYTGFTSPAQKTVTVGDGTVVEYEYSRINYQNPYKHILTGVNYNFVTTTGEAVYGQEFTVNTSYGVQAPNGTKLSNTFASDYSGTKTTYSFGTKFTQPAKVINSEIYYDPVKYDIIYNLDGGTNNSSNPSTYTVLDKITFATPTKKGYDFFGWYLDEDFTKPITGINEGTNNNFTSAEDMYNKLSTRSTGKVTLYAKFIIHDYKITTNIKSGVGVVSDISKVEYLTNTAVIITTGNGHRISKIEVDGVEINFNQGSQTVIKEFTNVEADHIVDVWFEAEDYWKNELDTYHKYEWMDLKFN